MVVFSVGCTKRLGCSTPLTGKVVTNKALKLFPVFLYILILVIGIEDVMGVLFYPTQHRMEVIFHGDSNELLAGFFSRKSAFRLQVYDLLAGLGVGEAVGVHRAMIRHTSLLYYLPMSRYKGQYYYVYQTTSRDGLFSMLDS
jgi:hypothetical protein